MFGRQWVFRGGFEPLRIRLESFGSRLDTQASDDSRLHTLLFALRAREPDALRVAQEVGRALATSAAAPSPDPRVDDRALDQLARSIERAVRLGQLTLTPIQPVVTTMRRPTPQVTALGPSSTPDDEETSTFEVCFVDEVGKALDGLEITISVPGRTEKRTTDGSGSAKLEGVVASFASVSVVSAAALRDMVESRPPRKGRAPDGPDVANRVASDIFESVSVEDGVKTTIVVKPARGKLFVELWDKSGRVSYTQHDYTIDGPASFSGTTDDSARLLHEDVQPGDYTLTITVEDQDFTAPLVVLEASESVPEIRFIGAVPRVELGRLKGGFFETNKSFLLPAIVDSFKHIRELYDENNPSELLIVGHADTTGNAGINDPLSLERADATAAYLIDDVDAWLKQYDAGVPAARRWGDHEDLLMIEAMPDFGTKPEDEDEVSWFQRTRDLKVDGIAGPKTRTQLITEYMALDGASLKDRRDFDIQITTHGAGENFPLDDSGDELDSDPEDGKEDAVDRRVELFFFDAEFGIQPPPPGKNSKKGSTEYPEWRKRAVLKHDLESDNVQGLVLEWPNDIDDLLPEDLVLSATQGEIAQNLEWSSGDVDGDFRRFVFSRILGGDPVTLEAKSDQLGADLVLWQDQVFNDPDNPPVWQHVLDEAVVASDPDGALEAGNEAPSFSDIGSRLNDASTDVFV